MSTSVSPSRARKQPAIRQQGSASKAKQSKPTESNEPERPLNPEQVLLLKRLASAQRTSRLDLSISTHLPQHAAAYHVFPRPIVVHKSSAHLVELWLSNHCIATLPPELARLSHLRVLGLAGNALSTIPREIAQLGRLESLYLERNRLHRISEDVAFPRGLRELLLDNNMLDEFPIQITELRMLNRLGLSNNCISAVPSRIRRLANLVQLDLDNNQIGPTLPDDAFRCLQKLQWLGIAGNQLAQHPNCLEQMRSLSYIRIDHDSIDMTVNLQDQDPPRVADTHARCVQCRDQHALNALHTRSLLGTS